MAHVGRFLELGDAHGDAPDGWRDENWFYIRIERWKDIHDAGDPIEAARMHKDAGWSRPRTGVCRSRWGGRWRGARVLMPSGRPRSCVPLKLKSGSSVMRRLCSASDIASMWLDR
jgi:hypothetical protein